MFHSKSFNLSGLLHKSKQNTRVSSVIEPPNHQTQNKQRLLNSLQIQNRNLKSQLQSSKSQIQQLKQLLISTRIQHDTQIRAYDQLIQQLRNQLSDKDSLLQKCALTFKQNFNQNPAIQEQLNEQDQEKQYQQNCQNQYKNQTQKQISQLLLQSTVGLKQKYQASLYELQSLRTQYQRLKSQLETMKEKSSMNLMMTNDVSFSGKTGSRISFDFGDIAAELQQVEEIAQFYNGLTPTVVDQQQIQVRQERIQNLQRQNFQLQHQIASKSHKIARIFNAAFQYGGMQLLDYLQNSIGLVQVKINQNQS